MATKVVNSQGTAGLKAPEVCGCTSWIEHWLRHTNSQRTTCMVNGCPKAPVVGAHVQKPRGKVVYIVGLCKTHNHPSKTDPFDIDDRTPWIPAEYMPGCGWLHYLVPSMVVIKTPTSNEKYQLIEVVREPDETDTAVWMAWNMGQMKKQKVTLTGRTVRLVE